MHAYPSMIATFDGFAASTADGWLDSIIRAIAAKAASLTQMELPVCWPHQRVICFASPSAANGDEQSHDVQDVQLARGGDGDAFERLIRRHQHMVTGLLAKFCRERGELDELVQDAFVQAYWHLSSYRADGPFGGWLRTIAVRVGYRYWQTRDKRSREQSAALEASRQQAAAAPDDSAAQAQDSQMAAKRVHAALAQLQPRDRLVLTLQYLQQFSVREIADATGWSESMVKVQALRARDRLRQVLERSSP